MLWITGGSATWVRYPYGCKDVSFPEGSGKYVAGRCTSDFTKFRQGQTLDYTPFLQHFSASLEQNDTVLNTVEVTRDGTLPPSDPGTAKDTLLKLASLTGGRLYTGGEVVKAIGESLQGNRARYQLALASASSDGKYHKLRVVCVRKGVRVETQRGYFGVSTPNP